MTADEILALAVQRAAPSTVPILKCNGPVPIQHGTGTLIRIAESHFLVSAAHVLTRSGFTNQQLSITGSDGRLVSLQSADCCHSVGQPSCWGDDCFDVALWRLNDQIVQQLPANEFLGQMDLQFDARLDKGKFFVFGYPIIWSTRSASDPYTIEQAPIAMVTGDYTGRTNFEAYKPEYNILLRYSPDEMLNSDGNEFPIPRHLNGISGCSIWKLHDENCQADKWDGSLARLVGVQTGVLDPPGVIKGTKWRAVINMMGSQWPELKRCFDLILPRPNAIAPQPS